MDMAPLNEASEGFAAYLSEVTDGDLTASAGAGDVLSVIAVAALAVATASTSRASPAGRSVQPGPIRPAW